MRLTNENLLQYSDLDEPQLFNQYLDRKILMIFANIGSFEKSITFMLKKVLLQVYGSK